MTQSVYGSRPDRLPPSVVRLTKEPHSAARWVARDGVELLDFEEYSMVEGRTLGGLSRRSDGAIDWGRHPEILIRSQTAELDALAGAVRDLVEAGESVIVLPGSSALPSFRVDAGMAVDVVLDLASRQTELWVLAEAQGVLLEYAYFHDSIVLARIPGMSGDVVAKHR